VKSDYAIVGRIRKPHGIHGELVVEPICDEPGATFATGRRVFAGGQAPTAALTSPRELEVLSSRPFKKQWLVSLRGINDRNEAELWRERFLLVKASELSPPSEGELWMHEMPGMHVVTVAGAPVGDVFEVQTLPQGLLLDVQTPRGIVSIPFVDAIVVGVDRAARTLTVDPPDGLLDL
jgi:16S rRNA processing protein RimM